MKKALPLLILISLIVTACGGQATPERVRVEPTKAQATPTQEAVAAESPTPEAAETPAQTSKSIMRIFFDWPTSIDPAVGNDYSSSVSLVNLYDSLVFPNAAGGVDPWLAESWEVSDDGLTWTFHLRSGVRFHDGSELQASDVVYSLNRLQAIDKGFSILFANVAGATAVDETTVKFTLSKPYALFLPSLVRLYILNEDLVREHTLASGDYGAEGDYGTEWLLTHDAGSGPYKVLEFPLDEYVLMEKHTGWWGEFAAKAPEQVRIMAITDPELVGSMLTSASIEFGSYIESIDNLEAQARVEGIQVALIPAAQAWYFSVNNRIPPTDDVYCRRAMAYALDYEAILAQQWPGTAQMRGPVPASLAGHNPDVFVYHRDMDKARQELAQCRYANKLDQYPIEIHWVAEAAYEERYAEIFRANMAELGISVKVVKVPWLEAVKNTSSLETSPHVFIVNVGADIPEAGQMLYLRYHSSTAGTWMQSEWLQDPKLDAALEDALATLDQKERFAKYAALQDQIVELCPSFFIYDIAWPISYRADYVDWPAARGEASPVMGYAFYAAHIGVDN